MERSSNRIYLQALFIRIDCENTNFTSQPTTAPPRDGQTLYWRMSECLLAVVVVAAVVVVVVVVAVVVVVCVVVFEGEQSKHQERCGQHVGQQAHGAAGTR